MYIRIVESSELRPELSLRASDYINKETNMNALTNQRLETGKAIRPSAIRALTDEEPTEVPALAIDQEWETIDSKRSKASDGGKRRVRIVAVGDTHAIAENTISGNRTSIRLSAFKAKGKKDYFPVNSGS